MRAALVLLACLGLAAAQAPGPAAAPGPVAAPAGIPSAAGSAPNDMVESLPDSAPLIANLPAAKLNVYSGYLNVNPAPAERDVFYTFVESESENKAKDPLVVWLPDAPGCSGAGLGAFKGPGPFVFEPSAGPVPRNITDLQLNKNIGSWTQFSNMLFLDLPSPTAGFSRTAQPPAPGTWGDANTTVDAVAALLAFYQRFPAFANSSLFLAGQGYAGHTAPLVASSLLKVNAARPGDKVPLAGLLVGNPWVDPELDNAAAIDFWYDTGLISAATHAALKTECDLKRVALWRTSGAANVTGGCEAARSAALQEAFPVDLWGVNAPECRLQQPVNVSGLSPASLLPPDGDIAEPQEVQPQEVQPPLQRRPGGIPQPFYDACYAWRLWQYMNRDDVQEALNAIKPGDAPRDWRACEPDAEYDLNSLLTSSAPAFKEVIDAGLRVLVYSGTDDGVMPTEGTRGWLEALGLPPGNAFRAWTDRGAWPGETSGMLEQYRGNQVTLATVLGAGHSAPYFKPVKVQQLARSFVTGTPF